MFGSAGGERMRKLGFWNRLAFVAFVLTIIAFPLWVVVQTNSDAGKFAHFSYSVCTQTAEEYPTKNIVAADNDCMNKYEAQYAEGAAGWGTYFLGIGIAIILFAILYGFIWIVVATSKWVWRGKAVSES